MMRRILRIPTILRTNSPASRPLKSVTPTFDRNIISFQPSKNSTTEYPTPIVLLNGEMLTPNIWADLIQVLSQRGYRGLAVDLFKSGREFHVDNIVTHLNNCINRAGFTPPLIIAHSLSSYYAQKYLESYAASGLILYNPLPPRYSLALSSGHQFQQSVKWPDILYHRLTNIITTQIHHNSAVEENIDIRHMISPTEVSRESLFHIISKYYSLISVEEAFFQYEDLSHANNALHTIYRQSKTNTDELNLEDNAMPCLLICSQLDMSLFGSLEHSSYIKSLREQFHIENDEDVIILPDDFTRASMIKSSDSLHRVSKLNNLIVDWIDECL